MHLVDVFIIRQQQQSDNITAMYELIMISCRSTEIYVQQTIKMAYRFIRIQKLSRPNMEVWLYEILGLETHQHQTFYNTIKQTK